MPPSITYGIPWYRRDDYARVLQIMADGDGLPPGYDEWQKLAEQAERMVRRQGGAPVRVPLDAEKFAAWCLARGLHVNGRARSLFASDPANWPGKH